MTPLRGARFTLQAKLAALAAATQLVTLVPLVWASDATDGWTRAVVFALLLLPGVLIVYLITRFIVTRLATAVIPAYQRVGAGDFAADLPLTSAGADFVQFRDAFTAMRAALDRSVHDLREADLERRRLFADLAHELATPVTTLLGIALALETGDGDRARLLGHLAHETARLDRLIDDVREVAHLEDPSLPMLRAPCDVAALAVLVAERARVAIAATTTIACDARPAPAQVDAQRIEQVLTNLVSNASRHAAGGRVAIAVRPEGGEVVLRVEDSGAGVPDDLLPALGRRLLRLDPSRSRDTGGHGLGLSIVRAIVARHGGQVTFARASLGGLAVEVRLPATPDDQNQVRSAQQ